jgi:two-component system nitrogen regulation response regulator NtrX
MEDKNVKILIVDDVPENVTILRTFLENEGYNISMAPNGEKAIEIASKILPQLILLDVMMPGQDGFQTCKKLKDSWLTHKIPIIFVTGKTSVDDIISGFEAGGSDYVTKPFTEQEILVRVKTHLQLTELKNKNLDWKIIGKSQAVQNLINQIEKIKKIDSNQVHVLIHGESGTGKELVARAIHSYSMFSHGPFVDINCGSIAETLQESELFGHQKGAFTDASEDKKGRLELSHDGVLFLDEISEMGLKTQASILRAIQEKSFYRIGGQKPIHINSFIISACNKDLKKEIEKGKFREDLYYRLSVFPIHIPPLRERKEDIPLLVGHFISKFNDELDKEIKSVSGETMLTLQNYQWPGNIRELSNILLRSMLLAEGDTLELNYLPDEILNAPKQNENNGKGEPETDDDSFNLEEAEKEYGITLPKDKIIPIKEIEKIVLQNALEIANGNVTYAAEQLGLSRSNLYKLIKTYNLNYSKN